MLTLKKSITMLKYIQGCGSLSKVKVMDELLANKIAAGEVVERCASVVKELVENSIDANATEIKIELEEAGTQKITVIDNGFGMDKEDAVLCFDRHATSKIKDEDDLFHINTLGFRGEALASIASVSEVVLKTCSDNVGTTVKIAGGKIIDVKASDSRIGTSITVSKLFYNTPARLKHMKSLYTELASITDYVDKIALSHPDIRFVLTNNGTTLLNTDGTDNLLKTISSVYGIEIAKKMIKIEGENDDYKIEGYITKPEIHRSNRNGLITLVNGRVVKNIDLNRAINDGYHSYQPDNRYPIVVINITVDASLIDVNIHPTKMDIKFSKLDVLLELVKKQIEKTLKDLVHIPIVQAVETLETVKNEDIIKEPKKKYEQYKIDDIKVLEEKEEKYVPKTDNEIKKELESPLFKIEKKEVKQTNNLPTLYPVGLVLGTYIVCQNEMGMTLIDQHAAKERCNYEIYKEKLSNPTKTSIPLLIPFNIELTSKEFIILKENLNIMLDMGYDIEEFGLNSFVIKAHPSWLKSEIIKEATMKIIEAITTKEKDFSLEKFNDHLAATLACKMSIKANTNLSLLEMQSLIDDLKKCDNPYHCPHGRPTMINYPKSELEKLFKRSGF